MLVKNLTMLQKDKDIITPQSIGHTDFEHVISEETEIPCVFNDITFSVEVQKLSVVGAETTEESDFLMECINRVKGSIGIFSVFTEGLGEHGTYLLADEDYNLSLTQNELKERGLLNEIIKDLAFDCGVPVYLSMTIKDESYNTILLTRYNGRNKHVTIVYKSNDPDEIISVFMRKCREEC